MKTSSWITKFLYVAAGCAACAFGSVTRAEAQLRPLDPTDFRAFDSSARLRVYAGAGVYFSQHASLAGVRGRLIELGDMRVSWRSGRMLVEVAGTLQRFLREDTIVSAPADGVAASSPDRRRRDAGDYRVQTLMRLTSDTSLTSVVLRFGTRLPTTDNRVGLERDQTDFFASLGAARAFGHMHAMAEAGVGINGTRLSEYEQSDVMIYGATIEYRGGSIAPFVSVVGQEDMHTHAVRGNEDLGEVRLGLRVGGAQWLQAMMVHGFHDSSPHAGFVIGAGTAWGGAR